MARRRRNRSRTAKKSNLTLLTTLVFVFRETDANPSLLSSKDDDEEEDKDPEKKKMLEKLSGKFKSCLFSRGQIQNGAFENFERGMRDQVLIRNELFIQ